MGKCIHEGCGALLRDGAEWCHHCTRSQTWQALRFGRNRRAAKPNALAEASRAHLKRTGRMAHIRDIDGRRAKSAFQCLRDEPDDIELSGRGCTHWMDPATKRNVIR